MFSFFEKKDPQIQEDVRNELKWDPSLTSTDISVTSSDGIVTLRGSVPHYIEKLMAEHAAQRVGGVRAVADELEVKGIYERPDVEIARNAMSALEWNYSVPKTVKVAVDKGWINLSGTVEWDYQRNAAHNAVKEIFGVCGVTDNIAIETKAQPDDIKYRIEEALKRSAESESRQISVSVAGDKVTLAGIVHSYSEREDARMAAWCAPGVKTVENNIRIGQ